MRKYTYLLVVYNPLVMGVKSSSQVRSNSDEFLFEKAGSIVLLVLILEYPVL